MEERRDDLNGFLVRLEQVGVADARGLAQNHST